MRLAKATADLYGDAVDQLLRIVARRLARGIDAPGWAGNKLLEVVELRRQALMVVDDLMAATPGAVDAAIRAGWSAGAGGLTNETQVAALITETVSSVTQIQGGILRSVDDIYRTVVAEATGPTVAGATTRRQAAQQALDRFARTGIAGFRDRAGRNWSIETYAEMATRTTVGRAQVAGSLQRYTDQGADLVIVSDAPQECKVCRRWEGKVLSITGNTSTGTRVGGFTVAGTVREAQAAGLHHPNCRHRLGKFVPGLTGRMVDTADPEGDRARAEQRRLERNVREWKRRAAVALDDQTARQASARAREWQSRLSDHVDANDLKRQPQRERIGTTNQPPPPAPVKRPPPSGRQLTTGDLAKAEGDEVAELSRRAASGEITAAESRRGIAAVYERAAERTGHSVPKSLQRKR